MKSRILFCLLSFVTLLSSTQKALAFDHSAWDALLKAHVVTLRDGAATQVDYRGMLTNRAKLTSYLRSLSSISRKEFDQWPREEQLAFLINSYNAWTIDLILGAYPKLDSIKDLGSFWQSPWKKNFISLLGETRSLDDIEHKLIRGSNRYREPRIHFAVNCASIGCPALRPEAYTGDKLDTQLDDATRRFLADRTRNRFEGNELKVSKIFDWYREDFEQGWRDAHSLAQFFALYRAELGINDYFAQRLIAGHIDISFLNYDWRLNRTP